MKNIYFHPAAKLEASEAVIFYEQRVAGLGGRFITSIENAVNVVRSNPLHFRKIEGGLRKYKIPHFPYGIIFRARHDFIEIIAVMHLHRKPGYWENRL